MENQQISPWSLRKSKYQPAKDEFDEEEQRKIPSAKIVFRNNFTGRLYAPPEVKSQRITMPKQPIIQSKLVMPNPLIIQMSEKPELPELKFKRKGRMNNSPAINLLKSSYRKWKRSNGRKMQRLSHQQKTRKNNKVYLHHYDLFKFKY